MLVYGRNVSPSEFSSLKILKNHPAIHQLNRLIVASLEISGEHDQVIHQHIQENIISEDALWAVTQSDILLHHLPERDEELWFETEVVRLRGMFVTRLFRILDAEQEEVYAELYMQFVALNMKTRTMETVDILQLQALGMEDHLVQHRFPRLRLEETDELVQTDRLTIIDDHIDNLNHVNNLFYINWAFEGLSNAFIQGKKLQQLSIRYGKELLLGHEVAVKSYENHGLEDQWQTKHLIENETTQEESCFIRFIWKEIEGEK